MATRLTAQRPCRTGTQERRRQVPCRCAVQPVGRMLHGSATQRLRSSSKAFENKTAELGRAFVCDVGRAEGAGHRSHYGKREPLFFCSGWEEGLGVHAMTASKSQGWREGGEKVEGASRVCFMRHSCYLSMNKCTLGWWLDEGGGCVWMLCV